MSFVLLHLTSTHMAPSSLKGVRPAVCGLQGPLTSRQRNASLEG